MIQYFVVIYNTRYIILINSYNFRYLFRKIKHRELNLKNISTLFFVKSCIMLCT